MRYYVMDLDGVCYPFMKNLGENAAMLLDKDPADFPVINTWTNTFEQWGWDREFFLEMYARCVKEAHLLWEGDPFPGAQEGWQELLRREGAFIHVVTDRNPPGAEAEAHEATEYWLATSGMFYDEIDFTADKVGAVKARLERIDDPHIKVSTIDDRVVNYEAFRDAGWESFLFDLGQNEDVNAPLRVSSVDDFARRT